MNNFNKAVAIIALLLVTGQSFSMARLRGLFKSKPGNALVEFNPAAQNNKKMRLLSGAVYAGSFAASSWYAHEQFKQKSADEAFSKSYGLTKLTTPELHKRFKDNHDLTTKRFFVDDQNMPTPLAGEKYKNVVAPVIGLMAATILPVPVLSAGLGAGLGALVYKFGVLRDIKGNPSAVAQNITNYYHTKMAHKLLEQEIGTRTFDANHKNFLETQLAEIKLKETEALERQLRIDALEQRKSLILKQLETLEQQGSTLYQAIQQEQSGITKKYEQKAEALNTNKETLHKQLEQIESAREQFNLPQDQA